MTSAVIVEPLAHHRELMPLVAEWFVSEWPSWYGPGGLGNIAQDVETFAASDTALPVGMVNFEDEVPVGAAALKALSIPSHSHLSPWAAAGYVSPACRGRGLGALLLQGLVARAQELGHRRVYCGTSTAERLLLRAGWLPLEVTSLEGMPLTVFQSAG
jgi:GNAT superfamily N-acetyltransferase